MIIRLDDLAGAILAETTDQIERMRTRGHMSCVRAFMMGESPACTRMAVEWGGLAKQCGVTFSVHSLPENVSMQDLDARLDAVAMDPDITGVCLLPPISSERDLLRMMRRMPVEKDFLGMHPQNLGLSIGGTDTLFTPMAQAVMAALSVSHVDLFGRSIMLTGDAHTLTVPLMAVLARFLARVTVVPADAPDFQKLASEHDILVLEGADVGSVTHVKDGAVALDLSARGGGNIEALAGGALGPEVLDQAAAVLCAGGIDVLRNAFVMQNIMECSRSQQARVSPATPTWKGNQRK